MNFDLLIKFEKSHVGEVPRVVSTIFQCPGNEMTDENSRGNAGCSKENTNTAAIIAGLGRSVDTIATYKRSRPGSVSLKVLLLSEPANEEAKL
ncbi:unnamed protein product [Allacma fusca]|uniref:Uncharacterized protein n=1 Tax=Allacma fusca TaxID=39272 RepID=A0A8J2LEM7_9HEXA|nr:unnamed protein product [Allacma fusca]